MKLDVNIMLLEAYHICTYYLPVISNTDMTALRM
jgi:hypothetical protein